MPTKHDIRFTISVKTDSDGDTFTAHAVYMVKPERTSFNPNDAGVRNPSDHCEEPLAGLAGLAVVAYRKDDMNDNEWYGWDRVGYKEIYYVERRQIERMLKRLRQTETKLAKLDQTFGRPTDLASFMGRLAQAVGCTSDTPFGIYHKDVTINGTHYRWCDVDSLRYATAKPRANA